jgi:hydrogenase-4 component B
MSLYLAAVLLACLSGVPGLLLRRLGGEVAAGLMGLAAVLGLAAAARVLAGAQSWSLALPALPGGGSMGLLFDPIAAWFAVPIFLLAAAGALYGVGYWDERHGHVRLLRGVFGLLTGSLALLVAASHVLSFLLGWEGMAISAFLLVMAEDREPATQRAGWIYLVATHLGTLALIGAFALMMAATGHGRLEALPVGWAASAQGRLAFALFLAAFAMKAGAMPLHVWLPPAHAAAPSHVSALMSGVLIKMGILGLVRLVAWVPDPPWWWGGVFLGLGALSGILGVAFALGQHDLKRLLAYHSIENIGIILLGLGLGTLGKATGHPVIQALGFAGALLHVLNHSLFKGLLFLAAGSVIHATGEREMDRLGGLGRAMPWTSGAFLVGAWAIAGLPPLNGFVSEWMIYLGAFRGFTLSRWPWTAGVVTALALIGALALACFAKAFGAVFLGEGRTRAAGEAVESPLSMRVPMVGLALACAVIGLAPGLLAPGLARAVAGLDVPFEAPDLVQAAHLPLLSAVALALLTLAGLLWAWARPRRVVQKQPTWDCGYADPQARMQFTASSFADGLVGGLRWVLWPRVRRNRIRAPFPAHAHYESHVPDPVLDRLLDPVLRLLAKGAALLRFFQGGHLAVYLLYVLLTLLSLLIWMVA